MDPREEGNSEIGSALNEENARFEFIDKIIQKSIGKQSIQEKEETYSQNLPKLNKFTLEECIDNILNQTNSEYDQKSLSNLRTVKPVDVQALTKGFDAEEAEEGKMVIYITEAQLKQLLEQRAVIVPNAKNGNIPNQASSFSQPNIVDKVVDAYNYDRGGGNNSSYSSNNQQGSYGSNGQVSKAGQGPCVDYESSQ